MLLKTISLIVAGSILAAAVGGEAVSVCADDTDLPSKTGSQTYSQVHNKAFPDYGRDIYVPRIMEVEA